MFNRQPPRTIRYVYGENFVERIIEADGRVLSVDRFRRTAGDPTPAQLAARIVDCPVVDLPTRRVYQGAERRRHRATTDSSSCELDERWHEAS